MPEDYFRAINGISSPSGGESWWAARACPAFDPSKSGEAYLLDDVFPFALEAFGVRRWINDSAG